MPHVPPHIHLTILISEERKKKRRKKNSLAIHSLLVAQSSLGLLSGPVILCGRERTQPFLHGGDQGAALSLEGVVLTFKAQLLLLHQPRRGSDVMEEQRHTGSVEAVVVQVTEPVGSPGPTQQGCIPVSSINSVSQLGGSCHQGTFGKVWVYFFF